MKDFATPQEKWAQARLAPLWASPNAHKPPQPPEAGHIWRWQDIRPLIELAFSETSPAAVERRVLQMIAPSAQMPHEEYTVGTILGAIQCLAPGEVARPHRHSMNALRFVVEGSGATTIVDGKPCRMEEGDLILTPAWCWHEHRHDGQEPLLWLDVLDVPLHAGLGTVRFQPPPIMEMPVTMEDKAFTVPNIVPLELAGRRDHSPVFRYPYQDALRALAYAPASADGAKRVRYSDPVGGGPAMQILECQMMEIASGLTTKPMKTNANQLYCVVEGEGFSQIGANRISWAKGDILTAPQWNEVSHHADQTARLFVVTDRDVMQRLGFLVEGLANA